MLMLVVSSYYFCHTLSGVNQRLIFFLISLNFSPLSNCEAACKNNFHIYKQNDGKLLLWSKEMFFCKSDFRLVTVELEMHTLSNVFIFRNYEVDCLLLVPL